MPYSIYRDGSKKNGCPIVCVQSDMFNTHLVISFYGPYLSFSSVFNRITIIQTRRSATGFGLVHPHHSVLKQLKLFSTDSQASTCRYTPFCSVPFCAWLRLHRKRSLELVSQAQPTSFRSTDRFQYRHAEEWSGDLGSLHENLY